MKFTRKKTVIAAALILLVIIGLISKENVATIAEYHAEQLAAR